jgi:hypothetical protein
MSQDTLSGSPGPGPERERVRPEDAVTEKFAAITTNQLSDLAGQSAADRMREERLRQPQAVADAREAVAGAGRQVDRGMRDLGRTEVPRSSAHPEVNTGPIPRLDRGNTAPQAALTETSFTATRPQAALGDLPANPMPRQEDPGTNKGYRGMHRAKEGFEPQSPIANADYDGEHRRTGVMGRLRSGLRNGINRLRNKG